MDANINTLMLMYSYGIIYQKSNLLDLNKNIAICLNDFNKEGFGLRKRKI